MPELLEPVVLLTQLLQALFDDGIELRRFLTLAGLEEVEHKMPTTKDESIRSAASQAAYHAERLGLVGPPLFEALVRRAPDRADDIWAVADAYGLMRADPGREGFEDPEPEAPEEQHGKEVDARFAGLIAALDEQLSSVVLEATPAELALGAERWPWTGAAAVLGSFQPKEIQPLPGPLPKERSALVALSDVVFTNAGGRWVLDDEVRAHALLELDCRGALDSALAANATLSDPHRDWMRQLLAFEVPSLAMLDTRELTIVDTVSRWLEPLGLNLPVRPADLYAAMERRSLIDPLRKLAGHHFRGRADEGEQIADHLRGQGQASLMIVWGPGGAGKSSLLGKVLLEFEEQVAWAPLSFAYVDFDKTRHDPANPRGLIEQIARQLRLLYATNAEAGRQLSGIESITAGTDLDLAAEVLDLDSEPADLDVRELIAQLARRLEAIHGAYPTPLALVFDTFEEVQIRGPGAVADMRTLIDMLEETIPGIRIAISGRGDLRGILGTAGTPVVTLGDLDPASADEALESRGVAPAELRRLVYERFGGNPLTLRLAAEALERVGTAEEAFTGALGQADVLTAIGLEQVQGMLYDRILGHLGDPEIVRVAQPGLAVRRVDVDVIREVLSGPCDLDPAEAESIFDRLELEVSMFEPDGDGALRHRQDVRRLMLRAMVVDPAVAGLLTEIHRRAITFYRDRPEPWARAEELYHRLMVGEDPRNLHALWRTDLRDSLFPALEDPLPQAAVTWLSRRLGLVSDADERADWEHEDWEGEAADRAASWIASQNPAAALEVLSERERRIPGSRLYPLQVTVLMMLGRLEEAKLVLDTGMLSSVEANAIDTQLALADAALTLGMLRGDAEALLEAAELGARLSDLTGDSAHGIQALVAADFSLRAIGAANQADRLTEEISKRFLAFPLDLLRRNADLARVVVVSAGQSDSAVLERALALADDTASPFKDDTFTLGRLLESTPPEARPALNQLAVDVGLPEDKWTPFELAASVVQRGRTGEALAIALDYAADEGATRQSIVSGLTEMPDISFFGLPGLTEFPPFEVG
jgi:hypothetical protein